MEDVEQLPPSTVDKQTLDEQQLQKQLPAITPEASRPATNLSWARMVCSLRIAGRVVMCVLIVGVWMVMSVPTVIFYLPRNDSSDSLVTSDASTCGDREVYVGEACRDTLQDLQSCPLGDQSDRTIYIPSTDGRQEEIEAQAQLLLSYLPLLQPSQECEEDVMPLLCLYLFKLCTGQGNGTIHQVSSQQCLQVTTDTCLSEWRMAEMILDGGILPDCSSLPEQDDLPVCQNASIGSTSGSGVLVPMESNTSTTEDNITSGHMCSDDFFDDGRICQPECGEWEEWSPVTVDTTDGFVILASASAVIATAIILVISCVQYKRMLKFPTTILVYQSVSIFVIGSLILVGYMDRKALFCSSRSLLKNFNNPTAFCTITGVAFAYILLQLMIWWFCHAAMIFWTINFPIHYRIHQKSSLITCIHVTVVVVGLVIPVVPVGVTFTTGEFAVTRYPPIVCLPDNEDAPFYSTVLPMSILLTVGVSLLIKVFFKILEVSICTANDLCWRPQLVWERNYKVIRGSAEIRIAQAKIGVVLVFYVFLAVNALTAFTIDTRNRSRFGDELLAYFTCESRGTGESCDQSGFMKYNNPVPSAIAFATLGLVAVIMLLYVVKFPHVKEKFNECFTRKTTNSRRIGGSTTKHSRSTTVRTLV